jgi:hypothetical protein
LRSASLVLKAKAWWWSKSGAGIGGDSHTVDGQGAGFQLFLRTHARILVEARASPIPGVTDQPRAHRIQVNVSNLLVIFLHRAQGAIEKARLLQFSLCAPAPVNSRHRTLLHAFNDLRNRRRVPRRGDAMPVVGEKNPGRQIERVQRAGTVESAGQQPKEKTGTAKSAVRAAPFRAFEGRPELSGCFLSEAAAK